MESCDFVVYVSSYGAYVSESVPLTGDFERQSDAWAGKSNGSETCCDGFVT